MVAIFFKIRLKYGMSKKDKKRIKINHAISHYFDQDPFDVGVARVSSGTLYELFMVLGFYDMPEDKESLLRLIRGIWSEGDVASRGIILDFFKHNQKIYKSNRPKEPDLQKKQKIELLLSEFELNAKEEEELFLYLSDMRSKKITHEKIASKLEHMRFNEKKDLLARSVYGNFDADDMLEFHGVLTYKLFGESFKKIVELKSKPYELGSLLSEDFELLRARLLADKEKTVEQKQSELDAFLARLSKKNRYISPKMMLELLKSSPPSQNITSPLINKELIFEILRKELDLLELKIYKDELLLVLKQTMQLPKSSLTKEYELEIVLESKELFRAIWLDEDINFKALLSSATKQHEDTFLEQLNSLIDECKKYSTLLKLDEMALYTLVYEHLLSMLHSKLNINAKTANRALRAFVHSIQEQLQKKQRYEFLARSIRDFKSLFSTARSMKRKITLHVGPTNSGKTYAALQKLKNADTGYYLAPLRLLALEGYESLKNSGINASLITGEEQLLSSATTHISSTIEMLNFDVWVDCCVIDEAQMIDERDRGWAWVNAIIGAPAKELILTASSDAKDAIIKLCEYLNEELEIVEFERKNPLTLLEKATHESDIKAGSAIVAFSRREVLFLKQKLLDRFSISVVYGNLSPEVRREEARRFRDKQSEILIATDAIAMGLNLPIKTILFAKATKFDGKKDRELYPSEIKQIAGRAGRYGLDEHGYVGALNENILRSIKKGLNKEARDISLPLRVMANLEHIKLISSLLEEKSLKVVLDFFVKNMSFSGPFVATNLDDMLEACDIIDAYELDIVTKYHLATAPLSLSSPYLMNVFESYLLLLENKQSIKYTPPILKNMVAATNEELLRVEDMVKEISLYLWLSFRFEEYFSDTALATQTRMLLNSYISNTLQAGHIKKECRSCKAPIKASSAHNICDRCFKTLHKKPRFKR